MTKEERDDLIVKNRGLVHMVVNKLWNNFKVRTWYTDFDDAVQTGMVALCRAADLFDSTRGFQFSTYATTAIRNHVLGVARADKERKNSPMVFINNASDTVLRLEKKGQSGDTVSLTMDKFVVDEKADFGIKHIDDAEEASFFIAKINKTHRDLVKDCIMMGIPPKEKAKEMKCSAQNVQIKIQVAVAQMQGNCRECFSHLTFQGQTRRKADWAKITGISIKTIESRIARGWTDEKILTTFHQRKTPEEKLEAVLEMNKAGASITKIAKKFGMSRIWVSEIIGNKVEEKV